MILVGADKGLCGALERQRAPRGRDLRQGLDRVHHGRAPGRPVRRPHRPQLAAEFAYGDNPTFAEARAIASFARDLFLKREVDEVSWWPPLRQHAHAGAGDPRVPARGRDQGAEDPGRRSREGAEGRAKTLFEPDAESVLTFLLGHYLNIFIHQVLLNAKASEQSARMVSMKNATDDADGLIKDLTLDYNKLRQGNITKELLEIAGGQSD